MNEKVTNGSLFAMVMTTICDLLGILEAHTALIGVMLSAIFGAASIFYTRMNLLARQASNEEKKRANDIAERQLELQEINMTEEQRVKQPVTDPDKSKEK